MMHALLFVALIVSAAAVIYMAGSLVAAVIHCLILDVRDLRRRRGDRFDGESVFQIAKNDPPCDLGPAFPTHIESHGGFRHGGVR